MILGVDGSGAEKKEGCAAQCICAYQMPSISPLSKCLNNST
jgi:hypothetical protein